MAKIEARFADKAAAEAARSQLLELGLNADAIHLWNIIPEKSNEGYSGDATEAGAVIGGTIAGTGGLLAGAAIGDSYDNGHDHMPLPSGVRLVVDNSAANLDQADIERALHAAGASAIHLTHAT